MKLMVPRKGDFIYSFELLKLGLTVSQVGKADEDPTFVGLRVEG